MKTGDRHGKRHLFGNNLIRCYCTCKAIIFRADFKALLNLAYYILISVREIILGLTKVAVSH